MQIKDILYSSIEKSKSEIISNLSANKSDKVIEAVYKDCKPELAKLDGNKTENFLSFAEGLFHYLLTTTLIPSQRKITLDEVYIDVCIPDTKTLKSSPGESIVITFPKTDDIKEIKNRIFELTKIQQNKDNIWVVLRKHSNLPARVYILEQGGTNNFSDILHDITKFFADKKQTKLKMFKI